MRRAITTVLDLVGLLLIVAAAALVVSFWSIPGAVGSAGAGVLAVSWLIDRRGAGR